MHAIIIVEAKSLFERIWEFRNCKKQFLFLWKLRNYFHIYRFYVHVYACAGICLATSRTQWCFLWLVYIWCHMGQTAAMTIAKWSYGSSLGTIVAVLIDAKFPVKRPLFDWHLKHIMLLWLVSCNLRFFSIFE